MKLAPACLVVSARRQRVGRETDCSATIRRQNPATPVLGEKGAP